jgi:DNA-directed RNA polymerase subunit beta
MSFSKIKEVLEMPNLIEIQKKSYRWFLEEGLTDVFSDVSPVTDYTGNLVLEFVDHRIDEAPKYSVQECKERDTTYQAPLRVKVRLINTETGEIKEQEIFMGDFPLMTPTGTFIINGAERVIVSQLVRSPGVYYTSKTDKTGKNLFANTVIPNRGAWIEYETDSKDILYVRIDRTRKLPITVLLRALGYGTDSDIIDLLGEDYRLDATFAKDSGRTVEDGLFEIYHRLRPGEPPTKESATTLFNNMFFDPRRYDLARFGRYKFNKKLAISTRVVGCEAAENIVDPGTGEVIVAKGEVINEDNALQIECAGINEVWVATEEKVIKVIGNGTAELSEFVDFNYKEFGLSEKGTYSVIK